MTPEEELAALRAENSARLQRLSHKEQIVREAVAEVQDQSWIWINGVEPMPFDQFAEALDGSGLFPHQRKILTKAGMLRAYDWIREERQLSQLVLSWGKGCLSGDTLLKDELTGDVLTAEQWCESGRRLHSLSWDGARNVVKETSGVEYKGTTRLLRAKLVDGRSFRCTEQHECLTDQGWMSIDDVRHGSGLSLWTAEGFVPVAWILADSVCKYYDLSVQGTACYYDASGILHHNSGKDYISAKLLAYVAYIVLHIRPEGRYPDDARWSENPKGYHSQQPKGPRWRSRAEFFGLALKSELSIVNVAPSQEHARRVFFGQYLSSFLKTDLFKPFNPQILTDTISFFTDKERQAHIETRGQNKMQPWLVLYSLHSKSSAFDGMNLLAWVMDEADEFLDSDDNSNAERVYEVLCASATTRLLDRWFGVVISYPRVDEGFMERKYAAAIKEMESMGAKATMFGDKASTFEVNPRVSRETPDVARAYREDPARARAMYECIPMSAEQAFFDFPELITRASASNRQPCAIVRYENIEREIHAGGKQYFVTATVNSIQRTPGYVYFMGGDGGVSGDAFTMSVFHFDDQSGVFGWLCPRCGNDPVMRSGGRYDQMGLAETRQVAAANTIVCGGCGNQPPPRLIVGGQATVSIGQWWEATKTDESQLIVEGSAVNIGTLYEDLIVRIVPVHATHKGEVDRTVDFVGVQQLCKDLIVGLGIVQARFDVYQTVQLTQALVAMTGADAQTILFSNPEQVKRARLVKALLHAGLLVLLPNEIRDKEWRRMELKNGTKLDHPVGGSKDIYDSESVAIWQAAAYKDSRVNLLFS